MFFIVVGYVWLKIWLKYILQQRAPILFTGSQFATNSSFSKAHQTHPCYPSVSRVWG